MGSGIGVVIEAWKVCAVYLLHHVQILTTLILMQITKAVDISLGPAPAGAWIPYKLVIKGMCEYVATPPEGVLRRQRGESAAFLSPSTLTSSLFQTNTF